MNQAEEQMSVERLSRDLVSAAKTLSDGEARFLVDAYYMMQEDRKRANNQVKALDAAQEPNAVLTWIAKQSETLEKQLARALDKYTDAHPMGGYMRQTHGIGPVLSAGLLAHVDIEKAVTVGHIWRYAGLDSTVIWPNEDMARKWVKENGVNIEAAANHFGRNPQSLRRIVTTDSDGAERKATADNLVKALLRRPWNAGLKVICWKIGQSFMKFSGDDKCYYGKVYLERKRFEIERNESGGNAETAAKTLAAKNWKKDTEAYKAYVVGKLPPAQIDARARRYAVKLFLSHMWEEWYKLHHGKEPPLPYPIAHLGHVHKIEPPAKK